MASNEGTPLNLPGYGLPVNYMPPSRARFPITLGDREDVWRSETLTLREVCWLRFIEEITNKPEWWVKVRDDEIANRWKQEALAFDWNAYKEHADFSPAMADAAIKELRDKAELYEKTGLVPVMDSSVSAIKSDKLMSKDLQEALKKAVAVLENVPEDRKDWHPGSDDKVLDLVHPSLCPLIYGKSRILPNKTIGLQDCLQYCGTGDVIPLPERRQVFDSSSYVDNSFSTTFQWLPCDVNIDENGRAKIVSYINNLHPSRHANLYPIIEQFIQKSLPAWDLVYRWPEDFPGQRLPTTQVGKLCTTPEACEPHYECTQTNRPLNEGEEPRDEDEAWEPEYASSERERLDLAWFLETHKMDLPDVDPDGYTYFGPQPDEVKTSTGFFNGKSKLQVIVKLANIHLTPEKPRYDGGSWHVEGQINEHICASALFYYDSDNVTDSHLGFRVVADNDDLSSTLGYAQGDMDSINRTFAIDPDGSIIQELGSVLTREGRALFFPNVYQHRVSPFELADPSRPGHRKILALFLVDPKIPIISTANVPPQQKEWWREASRLTRGGGRLPAELTNMVVDSVDFVMDDDEAKVWRNRLMEERSVANVHAQGVMERWEWNFCEH